MFASLEKIQAFFNLKDMNHEYMSESQSESTVIEVKNGYFYWNKEGKKKPEKDKDGKDKKEEKVEKEEKEEIKEDKDVKDVKDDKDDKDEEP